jgi:hypothetical protein
MVNLSRIGHLRQVTVAITGDCAEHQHDILQMGAAHIRRVDDPQIARLEADIVKKQASRSAADQFFKR